MAGRAMAMASSQSEGRCRLISLPLERCTGGLGFEWLGRQFAHADRDLVAGIRLGGINVFGQRLDQDLGIRTLLAGVIEH